MILYKNGHQTMIDEMALSQLCLNLVGGGFTFDESAQAMKYQTDLVEGKAIEVDGNTYRLEK